MKVCSEYCQDGSSVVMRMKDNGRGERPTQVDLEDVERRLRWMNREIWEKRWEVRRKEERGECYWCGKKYEG